MSGTEVDGDIFDEVVKSGVLTFKVPLPVMDLDVELVADQASSSVLTSLSPTSSHSSLVVAQTALSPALSHSSDSTVILESTRKRRNPTGLMDQNEAKQMVEGVLRANPKGEEVFNEYDKTKTLTDATRKQMVNILVADMIELHGRVPPSSVRTNYALGIVTLFPYLRDPFSKLGYDGTVICLQSFCCCIYSLQLQGARKKLPRSVQLKQPAILLDILRKEPVFLPSLRVSTQTTVPPLHR
uniref:uncharacterized protein LOC120821692 n=1 Tax=Gasterosteus aculeatus aculeatus TaxID=481459 RepID=UPI001A985FB1|nr:uncharacterized protein LOC120821692 [Gasterosteus aculeatus aculeatus]